MKKLLLMLCFVVSLWFLLLNAGSANFVLAQVYCPDTRCDTEGAIGPVEDCNSCPQDCGACPVPGYVQCPGINHCADGTPWVTYCTPSCSAVPRSCYDTPSCDWGTNCRDPNTCKMTNYDYVEGGCCPPPHCVGPVGCGKTICASGGNCYSDCSNCSGVTPGVTNPPVTPPPPPSVCTYPVTPTLKTPANGSNVGTLSTSLIWNAIIDWGYNPAGNSNSYEVYVNACGAPCTPTTLLGSTNSSTTSYNLTGLVRGTTYYWKVRSKNGCMFKDSDIWSFTVPNTSWIQGYKRLMPLNSLDPIVNGQTVTLDGTINDTRNWYSFNPVSQGNHTVSVTAPAGYSVTSTLCYNSIGCHTPACVQGKNLCPYTGVPLAPDPRGCDDSCTGAPVSQLGSSRTINAPYGYTDLWWHYTPLTCTISVSPHPPEDPLSIPRGASRPVVDDIQIIGGDASVVKDSVVSSLTFSSVNAAIATVNPSSTTFPSATYSTTATGVALGSTYIRSTATLINGNTCSCCIAGVDAGCAATTCARVTVVTPDPWFQSRGGDIHAQQEIDSPIVDAMSSTFFSLDLDTYPGLVSYNSSTLSPNFGAGSVSSKGWLSKSSYEPTYNFDYFYEKFGSPTVINFPCVPGTTPCNLPQPSAGKYIYYADPTLKVTIPPAGWKIPDNVKITVFVPGSLEIVGNVEVPVGSFLAFVVKGNININGGVGTKGVIGVFPTTSKPHLQGIYLTDSNINTYFNKAEDIATNPGKAYGSGFRLVTAGTFYGKTGVILPRDLKDDLDTMNNSNTPAETFIFRPDFVVNAPYKFWHSKIDWQEVVP